MFAGGSAIASDTIYREVLKLRLSGKPVIVSMGNVAASGGYYISAPATKIVAQPTTVTGSIGVVRCCLSFVLPMQEFAFKISLLALRNPWFIHYNLDLDHITMIAEEGPVNLVSVYETEMQMSFSTVSTGLWKVQHSRGAAAAGHQPLHCSRGEKRRCAVSLL